MNTTIITRLWMSLLFLLALSCMVSCSSDSEPEVYEPTSKEKYAYDYFKKRGYGSKGYEDFTNYTDYDINHLMYNSSWSHDTIVMKNGEHKLLNNQSVEITKNYYIEKNGKKTTKRRLRSIVKTVNGKLMFELEDGDVIQYDDIQWSVDQCCVTLTDKNGNVFCDNRKGWANSEFVYWWCNLQSPFIY